MDAWIADPSVTWENNRKPLPRPRSHVSVAHMAGKIVVFGGEHGHDWCAPGIVAGVDLAQVDIYDIETDTWTQMPDLPYPRSHSESMTFAMDGKIYQVGSEVNSTISKTTLVFDPVTNLWSEETSWELPTTIMAPAVAVWRDSLYISHGGYPGRNDPKAFTQYKTISRNPPYELGWNRDTVDFWVYEGLGATQKVFAWAKSGHLVANVAQVSPAAWLSTPASAELDIAGRRLSFTVNSTGLASGTYFTEVVLSGTGDDLIHPGTPVTYTNDTVVVRLTVGPSPDGVLLLNQPAVCEKVELGQSVSFPVEMITPGAVAISLTGSNLGDSQFALSGGLPGSLPALGQDSLWITFTPAATGTFNTVFTLTHNGTGGSSLVDLTCSAIPACEVPANWIDTTLGNPSIKGSACVTGSTYRINAGGNNIWSKNDQGRFLATPVSGNGEMVLKINWMDNAHEDTKVGIMFRQNLNDNSPNAFLCLNPEKSVKLQTRTAAGQSTNKVENLGQYAPHWLRLVRTGNSFAAYHSEDGITWALVIGGGNPATISMTDTIFAGIAFTSHVSNVEASAEIQFVSMNFTPVTFPVTLSGFDAKVVGESVLLNWEAASEENFSHYEVQRKSVRGSSFETVRIVAGQSLSSYHAWDHEPQPGTNIYRLGMVDIDGQMEYSDQVEVEIEPKGNFTVRQLPLEQALEINWQAANAAAQVRLLDITGREVSVQSKAFQQGALHYLALPGLSSGYFLLEVSWEGRTERRVISVN